MARNLNDQAAQDARMRRRQNSARHQRNLAREAGAFTGAGGGCLMALLLLPSTAILATADKAKKVKSSPVTRFGRAERRSLSNTGRAQAGLKPKKKAK